MTAKEAFGIAHSSKVLRQAVDLVSKAYALINSDETAREHLKFNAALGWKQGIWDALNEEYAVENPTSKETYFLRAFDYFGLQPGMDIGDGLVQCN